MELDVLKALGDETRYALYRRNRPRPAVAADTLPVDPAGIVPAASE